MRTTPPRLVKGKRDRAILTLLISCGLRRAELVGLEVDRIQQREGRWVIPDLVGKEIACAPTCWQRAQYGTLTNAHTEFTR